MTTSSRFHILVVCTGNICRSPMGEGILRHVLSPRALSVTRVGSAGTGAVSGLKASTHSVTACEEQGIDIADHRSTPLTPDLLRSTDLVLTLEMHHRDAARAAVPDRADRIHLLSEFAGMGAGGVADPIGGSLEEYRRTYAQIARQIQAAAPRIEEVIFATVES